MFNPMFVPPREHAGVMLCMHALLPAIARGMFGLRGVRVAEEDLGRLAALRGSRAIFSANHPSFKDAVVLLRLSRLLGTRFNYMAAREIMDGPRGWLLSRLGTYSVIRGVPDRESLRTTRRLLAEQDRQVVIFPEGEVYEHNDTLLAFQSGVAQIGFWALEDLRRLGKSPELPLVPIAIRYECCARPRPAIEASLRDLERAVKLDAKPALSLYARLLRVGDRVLARLERDAGLKPAEEGALPPRIRATREAMLARVARAVGTEVNPHQAPQEQLHLLFHELKSWVGLLPPDASDYDERLYRRKMEVAAPLFADLQRLQNFIAVTGDYVAAESTAERFLDVLGRLEQEVFGEVRNRVPRVAVVRAAAPIRLEERLEAYREGKRETVAAVTRELEATVRAMLQELSRGATPVEMA